MDDIACPQCKAINQPDAENCNDCDSSLLVGKLTSLGIGVLPKGFVWEMRPGDLSLGRNIANDFVIPSNLIAGEQLRFVYQEKGFSLLDVENKSRCSVGGRVITDTTKLRDGVTIKVGVEEFLFNWLGDNVQEISRVDPLANHLQLMLGVISEFHTSLNLQEVFNNAVDAVVRLTHTKRGYAFLVDANPDGEMELREVAARRTGGKALAEEDSSGYTISQSIIAQVVSGDEPIVIEDAGAQQVRTDTMLKFKLISVVCLPLVTFNHRTGKKRVMGVIYCDSPMPTGELPKHCRPTLQMLTQILTATIVKWQNYEKMETLFNTFEHSAAALEQDLVVVQKDIEMLRARGSEPDGVNKISTDEMDSELQALNARVNTAVTSLGRLQTSR
ncbi:MAG: GAF domain-containing protein [Lentisphaeria bacterium]